MLQSEISVDEFLTKLKSILEMVLVFSFLISVFFVFLANC